VKAIVVIPTYNEVQNIPNLVAAIKRAVPDLHVLIVDASSPDGTGNAVRELAAKYPGTLWLLSRPAGGGFARAYCDGFKEALRRNYEVILQMDADLSHDPAFLPRFLDEVTKWDLVLGSRYVRGVSVVNWDFRRLILSKLASLYARAVTRMPFTDLTGGFKCWRGEALKKIDLDRVFSSGYLFQIEMTWRAFRNGSRIGEIPIIFYEREVGHSKMSGKIIVEATWGVLTLPFRS
jgi:dolichol-phosphate mannosyltransferase